MRLTNRFRLIGLLILLTLVPLSALADLKVTFLNAVPGAALLQSGGQAMLWGAGTEGDADKLLPELNELSVDQPDLTALPAPGTRYDLGDAKVSLLASGLALRVTYGEHIFLLIQDAETFTQASLPGSDLKADVLAAGGSLPQALLNEAAPRLVISGAEPSAATSPSVLHTGNGAITFTIDGAAIRAEFTASGVTSQPSVNMRKEASKKADRAATLTKGTVLSILGAELFKEELWYKAEASGNTGYIRGDLVAFVSREEAETLKAQATPKPKKSTGGSKPKPPADDGSNSSGDEDPAPCH